ncbi:hypothetical protein [Chryseobacterium pennae]|uniref:hypothetical protein n=1 Tax=Chryseobacterium pennae TaxID=2258962 RepID=UPI001623370F|nr:hypothetical protein [Chryseobacterium pennae]
MKKNSINIKVFILNIIVLCVLSCALGVTDSAFHQVYTSDNVFSYCINAIKYFIFWILPYWWAVIIALAVILTVLYVMAGYIIKNFKVWIKKE